MAKRIGPRMTEAVTYIAAHPDCTKQQVSLAVGPNGSNKYGYLIVERCISHGLVNAEPVGRGYKLTLTEAGWKVAQTGLKTAIDARDYRSLSMYMSGEVRPA